MSFTSDASSASTLSSIATGSNICTVIADGIQYSNWLSVEVERNYDNVVAHMRLSVAEPGVSAAGGTGISALQLGPGDQVQGFLGGVQIIDGIVTARQAIYNANEHAVEIIVSSVVQNVIISTVDGNPGQYLNSTLQQIGSTVFGKVGVNFSVDGSASGADKPFPRVSEHIGETRYQFMERLGRMRNVHMVDDGNGGIMATRQANSSVAAALIEGVNILKARMIMKINESADYLAVVGQQPLNNQNWTQGPSSFASTSVPGVTANTPVTIAAEMPADNQDAAMRVNQERDFTLFDQLDCTITVQGWFNDAGQLWFQTVNQQVTVVSPMLFPDVTQTLWIKGVVHKQSNEEGTTTDLLLSFLPGGDGIATTGGDLPPPVNVGGTASVPGAGTPL